MEPSPRQDESAADTPSVGVSAAASNEFVITDAPLPDHTLTADDEPELTERSSKRTSRLLDLGKSRPSDKSTPRAERPSKQKKPVVPMPRGGFVEPLMEMYGFIALGLMAVDPQCAMAIMEAAPKAAESLDALAKKNPGVRRVLVMLTQTSAWGAVIAAHMPIIVAISVHHIPAVKNSPMASLLSGGIVPAEAPE